MAHPMKKHLLSALLSLSLLLLLSPPLYAESAGISKQQAASSVQSAYSGRVLAVRLRGNVYRVKILRANGDVRIISVDASSGKILSGR